MKYCFCVLGWYFYADFFEQLNRLAGDKFIVSHREAEFFEAADLPAGSTENLRLYPNVGLDWGLCSQFKQSTDLSPYDYVIYIHDDVLIRDPSFPERLKDLFLDPRVKVIGNGKNGTDWEFRFEKYRRRMVGDEEDDFLVRTVRGSFFAARTDIFDAIDDFPVYWKAQAGKNRTRATFPCEISAI